LKLFVEGYTDIALASFLGVYAILDGLGQGEDVWEWIGNYSDAICTAVTVTSCLSVVAMLFYSLKVASPLLLLEPGGKYEAIFEDFKVYQTKSVRFAVFSFWRRVLLIFILLKYSDLPAIQVKLLILLTLGYFSLLIHTRPYKDSQLVETANEGACLLACHFHHFLLFDCQV